MKAATGLPESRVSKNGEFLRFRWSSPKRLVVALNTSADTLIFDDEERTIPTTFTHLLEGINHLDPDERAAVRALIEGALLRHQARRLAG